MRKTAAGLLLAALMLGLALGCAPAGEEGEGLALWFPVDPALGEVSPVLETCLCAGEDRSIPGLMSALIAGPPAEETGLVSVIPAGTRVLSWSLADGVANVELSAPYARLAGVDLTLADCCITLTLVQLPGVDGVRVTVNGGGQSYRERRVIYPEDMLFSGAEGTAAEEDGAGR